MTGSGKAYGITGIKVIPTPAGTSPSARRRLVPLLAEILLCALVVLSTAARQPTPPTARAKWHTCKACKMLESSGTLEREGARGDAASNPIKPAAPIEHFSPSKVTIYRFTGIASFQVLRSPPQA